METIVTKEQLSNSPNGCDCTFVKIGGAGLKCYNDSEQRDRQYQLQQWFALRGLAPRAWFSFDFEGPDGSTIYAYYSEIVEVKGHDDYENKWYRAASDLRVELEEKFGINWTDDHGGNVGHNGERFVLIDLGYMSGGDLDDIEGLADDHNVE